VRDSLSHVLSNEDLTLLAAFDPDANVRRAARTLGVSKSTLSRRVTELEVRLGGDLFLRRGRTLTTTAFGELLIARARTASDALAEVAAAAAEASQVGGRLVVAASPLFAEVVLPRVLSRVLARHPRARVEARLSHGYSELFDERVDVAVRRGPLQDSTSLIARRLGLLSMTCVASPHADLPKATTPEAWAKEAPFIRVGARLEPFTLTLLLAGKKRSVAVSPRLAVDDQRLALALAEAGLGVAYVNTFFARAALATGRLVEVLPEARATEAAFAVHPRRGRPSPLLRDFLANLVEVCRGLAIWD
jgi:DNA-binding transcriptional LysR family regulator